MLGLKGELTITEAYDLIWTRERNCADSSLLKLKLIEFN